MDKSVDHIRATPLRGGRKLSGVCILLEIGGARILLDCGWEGNHSSKEEIVNLASNLVAAGGVDAILLSHSDFHHVGALPILLGREGLSNVPVICTTPVYKFSQQLLYDYVLNLKMEARDSVVTYDLDDIDKSFSAVRTVMFNQTVTIPDTRGIGDSEYRQPVTVTAIPSGRTIGGAMWRIDCGPAEVLYTVDINLRRDLVIDAASLDNIPASPALMITDGACVSRVAATAKRRKEKDESGQFITAIMDTLRAGGNVLVPCETAGRSLEVLQLLGKHWAEQKIGMYHLLFLSHMAQNIMELARCHLEWMSDSLNRDFYDKQHNPFDLSAVKVITSTALLEKKYPGPKVILASDPSLNCGLAKEMLVRWGSETRNRVIFYDHPDVGSLANRLQELVPRLPTTLTLHRPVRVPLSGQELADFRAEEERQRRLHEEEELRQRRQREIAELQAGQLAAGLEEGDGEEVGQKRALSMNFRDVIAKRLKTSAIAKYLTSNFQMFETQIPVILKQDEYGMSNDDLVFKDIQATETRYAVRDTRQQLRHRLSAHAAGAYTNGHGDGPGGDVEDGVDAAAVPAHQHSLSRNGRAKSSTTSSSSWKPVAQPFKLVAIEERVQFACGFKEFQLAGRADYKAVKALLQKVTPSRLLVVRGQDRDCDDLVQYARSQGIESFAPRDRRSVAFQVFTERLKLQIPRTLIPSQLQTVRPVGGAVSSGGGGGIGGGGGAGGDSSNHCTICVLKGDVAVVDSTAGMTQEGTRLLKYLGAKDGSGAVVSKLSELLALEDEESSSESDSAVAIMSEDASSLGVVSMGELSLTQLKQLLDSAGLKTETRLSSTGSLLVVQDQVLVKKDGGHFSIEGPPVKAFYDVRRVLYNQFAFL